MGVATAVELVGAGVSAYSAINEAKQKKKAAQALENLKTPAASNVAENLQVSTLGSDLQKEEAARTSATQVQALREAGTRGVIGGVGRVAAQNQNVNATTGANLDQQQKDINILAAQDEARVQNIQENRNIRDVSALSSQYNAANQNEQQDIGNVIQGAGMAANAIGNSDYFSAENVAEREYQRKLRNMKIDPTAGRNIYAGTNTIGTQIA